MRARIIRHRGVDLVRSLISPFIITSVCTMRFLVAVSLKLIICNHVAYGGVDVPAEGFDIHLWAVDPSGFLSGRAFPVIQESDEVFVEKLVKEKKVPVKHVEIAKNKTKIEFPKLASASRRDNGGSGDASMPSPVGPPRGGGN
jgi:hypothetical protein